MKRLTIAVALASMAALGQAEEKGGFEAKRQEQFAKMKEVKLEAVRGRIGVMQEAASCIQSAGGPDAMRSCEERERSAMEAHMKRMKERWDSLKPR